MKTEYSTFDIAKLFEIDRTRLQEWIDKGFFSPHRKAKGKGTRAVFTMDDLYRLRLFIWLLEIGRKRSDAREDCNVDFSNVGPSVGQIKYAVSSVSIQKGKVRGGSLKAYDRVPDASMRDSDLFKLVVNLQAIKSEVNALIEAMNE